MNGFAPEQLASFPPDIALAYAGVLKAPPKPVAFDQRWAAWGSGFGGSSTTNGDPAAGTNTVTARTFGFAAGMDYHFTPDAVAGFALGGGAMTATDTRSELGARFDDTTVFNGMSLVLRARAAWAHDSVSNPLLDAVFEALPGASFIVSGATPPKNSALTSASAELLLDKNWSLTAKFDVELANGSQTYAGTGTLGYSW